MGFTLEFIPADTDLTPWALGVSVLRADAKRPAQVVVPAHALAISTVVVQGQLWQLGRASQRVLMSPQYVQGSATRSQAFEGSADLVCASLMCVASVLPWLNRSSADRYVNQLAQPDSLGPVNLADLPPQPSNSVIASALMAALRSRMAKQTPNDQALAFLATLQQWDGQCLVPQGWHARRWQRACKGQLGITPKLLQRLVRLHQSAQLGLGSPPVSPSAMTTIWSEHALDAGYSDQSHMLRDYRELVGLTPARTSASGDSARLQALTIGANALLPRLLPGVTPAHSAVSDFSKT